MEKRQAIVMLGIPASGKGTQADILAKRIGANIIGIGDLVRAEIKNADRYSGRIKQIKEDYDKGIPQKDELIKELLDEEVEKSRGDLIFDNYPFSAAQITGFEQLIKKYNFSSPKIIYIKVDPESAIKRISTRRICDKCKKIYLDGESGALCHTDGCTGHLTQRPDDKYEVMKSRVEYAKPRIDHILKHYGGSDRVFGVNGEQTIARVAKQIEEII